MNFSETLKSIGFCDIDEVREIVVYSCVAVNYRYVAGCRYGEGSINVQWQVPVTSIFVSQYNAMQRYPATVANTLLAPGQMGHV